jgi:hypothetical protein
MTVKIDNTEPNVFPVIEKIDARAGLKNLNRGISGVSA